MLGRASATPAFPHVRHGLRRQAEHQVQVEIIKARFGAIPTAAITLSQSCNLPRSCKRFPWLALAAPSRPGSRPPCERCCKGRCEGFRVAFASDLLRLFDQECCKQRLQDASYLGLVQKRGRAPSEKDRIRSRMPRFRAATSNLADHRSISRDIRLLPGVRRKVEIRTPPHAERHVNVKPDGRLG